MSKSKEKKVKPIRNLNQENKIKFRCPNLKILIIQIKSDSDFSFSHDYFDFKYLYDIMNKVYTIEDDPGEVYKCIKQEIFNFNFEENMQYFKFTIILSNGYCTELLPSFKMKMGIFANRLISRKSIMKVIYNIQERKMNNEDS